MYVTIAYLYIVSPYYHRYLTHHITDETALIATLHFIRHSLSIHYNEQIDDEETTIKNVNQIIHVSPGQHNNTSTT